MQERSCHLNFILCDMAFLEILHASQITNAQNCTNHANSGNFYAFQGYQMG